MSSLYPSVIRTEDERVVAVTGCDSGIGCSLAALLSEDGYHVAASYLEAAPFRREKNIVCVRCDLRKEADIRRFADAVRTEAGKHGRLYALVHNAGIAKGSFSSST